MKTTYRQKAAGKAMTLQELRDFIGSLDGADGESTINAMTNLRAQLRTVEVVVESET